MLREIFVVFCGIRCQHIIAARRWGSLLYLQVAGLSLWMAETLNNSVHWVTPEEMSVGGLSELWQRSFSCQKCCQTLINGLWHGPVSSWCQISCQTVEIIPAGHLFAAWRNSPLTPRTIEIFRFLQAAPVVFQCSDIRGNMLSCLFLFNTLICLENVGHLVVVNCYNNEVISIFSDTPVDGLHSGFWRWGQEAELRLFTWETEQHWFQNLFSLSSSAEMHIPVISTCCCSSQ